MGEVQAGSPPGKATAKKWGRVGPHTQRSWGKWLQWCGQILYGQKRLRLNSRGGT